MPQFHETGYGKRFFDGQLPALISQLKSLNTNLSRMVEVGKMIVEWESDIKALVESFAVLSESFAVMTETDATKHRIAEIKVKVNDLLESIKEIGKEAGYEREGEVEEG